MSGLEDYLFKYVEVVDIDDIVHYGYIDVYTSAADNDDTEESIGLMPDENARVGIELYRSEIKSIKIID